MNAGQVRQSVKVSTLTMLITTIIVCLFTGRKADKKKEKNPHEQELTAKQRNPKAFAIQSVARAQKRFHR